MKENKILMIINEFPPVAESGVQRPLKFLKYLSRAGWQTYVITPKKPTKTVLDRTLENEIPNDTVIYKTFSLGITGRSTDALDDIRFRLAHSANPIKRFMWNGLKLVNDFFLPYDKQVGWIPFAVKKALEVIHKEQIRNIYITAFPFSAFLIGVWLKRLLGDKIFWVADYRDAWQFEPLFEQKTHFFRQRKIIRTETEILRSADHVVFPTEYIRSCYLAKYKSLKSKSSVITNGYDEDDFIDISPHKFDKFTFLYMGKLYSNMRNPIPLLRILSQFKNINFQLIHIGTIAKDIQALIEKDNFTFYHYWGYKPHHEALSYALGADVNLIINNDDPASQGVYTGKLFELIRAGRPILAIGPEKCIIEEVLSQTGTGLYVHVGDEKSMMQAVSSLLTGNYQHNPQMKIVRTFSRQILTDQLASIFAE